MKPAQLVAWINANPAPAAAAGVVLALVVVSGLHRNSAAAALPAAGNAPAPMGDDGTAAAAATNRASLNWIYAMTAVRGVLDQRAKLAPAPVAVRVGYPL